MTRPHRRILPLLIATLMLALPASAVANYYVTDRGARHITADAVHKKYGLSRAALSVACRPQGVAAASSGYKYHRWVCNWRAYSRGRCDGDERYIQGRILIAGQSGEGAYGSQVLKGAVCTDG